MAKSGKLIVVSGPSGVGKSTIMRGVLERAKCEYSVSVTTRDPRDDEVDARDYRFIDRRTFEEMIRRGELLEYAEVFGELYGTPIGPVKDALAAGRTMLLNIDVQGGLQVHREIPDATFMLILPPSLEELARRLRDRSSEELPELTDRLNQAEKEMDTAKQSGVYNHCVVNDDLETAVTQVLRILNQEHSKR